MDENKPEICQKLGELLKLTRADENIEYIGYDEERDCAFVVDSTTLSAIRLLNTAGDSGAQLIADVVKEFLS